MNLTAAGRRLIAPFHPVDDHDRVAAEGFFSEIYSTLTWNGPVLVGMALLLGADELTLAILFALPWLAQSAHWLGPWLEGRVRSRRQYVLPFFLACRGLWLLPVLLVAAGARGPLALGLAMAAVAGAVMFSMAGTNGWLAWMSAATPKHSHAEVFGRRAAAVALGTLLAEPLAGLLLDEFKRNGMERAGYGLVGTAAVICGAMAGWVLLRYPDARIERRDEPDVLGLAMLERPAYGKLIHWFLAWNIATGIARPFWMLYMLRHLDMSFTQIALHSVIEMGTRVATSRWWGGVIARRGSSRTLAGCAAAVSSIPLIWWFPTPDFLWPIWFEGVLTGFFWNGFNQAAFMEPIRRFDPPDRSRGLAWINAGGGICAFASMLLGGVLMKFLGGETAISFVTLFLASSALRASLAIWAMLNLCEPEAGGDNHPAGSPAAEQT
ncbi:MAG: hypothetical protein GMKNLPBB_03142 [Myxococcota bacterium]|nr:hypothetical protein [Myxococcota bacterium]